MIMDYVQKKEKPMASIVKQNLEIIPNDEKRIA